MVSDVPDLGTSVMGGNVNVRDLESFFAVADTLHFGKAAESLHLGQASVSESVARLERLLGSPLFTRTTRRVQITPFGQTFLDEARPPYETLRRAHRDAILQGRLRRDLRVGHTPELGHLLFPYLMADGDDGDPQEATSWNPVLMHTHEQLGALASGSIDVGICWQPAVTEPLEAVRLATCPFVALMKDDDPLRDVRRLRVRDLAGRQILMSPRADNRFIDARVESKLNEAGICSRSLAEVDRYDELAVNVVRRSMIAIHPASIVGLNRVPGIVARRLHDDDLELEIAAVVRSRSPGTQAFVQTLREATHRAIVDIDALLDDAVLDGDEASVDRQH